MDNFYSILEHFRGGSVLLTGASGYVGALVLEKLLRCTDIDKIYVLLRPKRGEDIQSRLQKMLQQSPVMHLLRDNAVLAKVSAISGDMTAVGLGISPSDKQLLQLEVQTVVHCAADIRLEMGIQQLLQANYEGTRQLLDLARSFNNLQAFVHVSSAYTNMNATPGSLVHESIYRLSYGDQLVSDQDLVRELLSMPAHNANLRAEGLLAQWNFPNNYTLSKHLAEYMVADYQKSFNLPVAIVRPTLISSVARDPYPGYTGNFAGHVGATLAFMAGLFDSPAASNYKASNVWDVIPADVCVNVILAAAAALASGAARTCARTPLYQGPSPQQQQPTKQDEEQGPLLIVHCGSSTTYPLTIMESWNWGVEAYGAWPMVPNLVWGKCAGPLDSSHEPNPRMAAVHIWITGLKIWLAAKLLTWLKKERIAKKLTVGFESFKVINQPKTDVNLRFSTNNMQRMAALLDPTEQDDFLLIWRPKGSTNSSRSTYATPVSTTPAITELKGGLKGLPGSPVKHKLIRASISTIDRSNSNGSEQSSMISDTDIVSDMDCGSVASAATALAGAPQKPGAVLTPELEEEVSRMRSVPVGEWRSFHINLGAFLYCTLFQMPVPPQSARITKPEVMRWLKIRPEDAVIEHTFKAYK